MAGPTRNMDHPKKVHKQKVPIFAIPAKAVLDNRVTKNPCLVSSRRLSFAQCSLTSGIGISVVRGCILFTGMTLLNHCVADNGLRLSQALGTFPTL